MDEACRRLETVEWPGAAILSTDADSQVAPNWISSESGGTGKWRGRSGRAESLSCRVNRIFLIRPPVCFIDTTTYTGGWCPGWNIAAILKLTTRGPGIIIILAPAWQLRLKSIRLSDVFRRGDLSKM